MRIRLRRFSPFRGPRADQTRTKLAKTADGIGLESPEPDGRRGPETRLRPSRASIRAAIAPRGKDRPLASEEIATNDDMFNEVRVDPEIGTITWPNGADLDPDVLHGDYEPAYRSRSTT